MITTAAAAEAVLTLVMGDSGSPAPGNKTHSLVLANERAGRGVLPAPEGA